MNAHEIQRYRVVVNHEEQYSLWPEDMENAIGWGDAGLSGSKEDCLAYIKRVWTDMRPLSLRKTMTHSTEHPATNGVNDITLPMWTGRSKVSVLLN